MKIFRSPFIPFCTTIALGLLFMLVGPDSLQAQCQISANLSSPEGIYLTESTPSLRLSARFSFGDEEGTYLWSTGDSTSFIIVNTAGIYSVTVTDSDDPNCFDSASITIYSTSGCGTIAASATELNCEVNSINLDVASTLGASGPGAIDYQWSTGSTEPNITITEPGEYWAIARGDSILCFDTAFISITQNITPPQAQIDAFPDFLLDCSVPNILTSLSSQPAFAFTSEWSTGQRDSIIEITEPGVYSLITTRFDNGCQDTAFIEIFNALGFDSEVSERCQGDPFEVDFESQIQGDTSFILFPWVGPNGFVSDETNLFIPSVSLDNAGTYTRRVIRPGNTCEDTIRITLPIGTPGTEVNIISNTPICQGEDLQLSGTGDSVLFWVWLTPDADPLFLESPELVRTPGEVQEGTFILAGLVDEDGDECPGFDTLVVSISPNPTIEIASNAPICENEDLELAGIGDSVVSWSWTSPGGNTFSTQDVSISNENVEPGLYALIGANENNCADTAVVDVMFLSGQSIATNFLVGSMACTGEAFQFIDYSAGVDPSNLSSVSFSWDFGNGDTSTDRDPVYAYSTPGIYDISLDVTSGECPNVSVTKRVEVLSCLKEGELVAVNSALSPSLNNGRFEVSMELSEPSPFILQVFDYNGQLIHAEDIDLGKSFRRTVQLTHNGMYFVRIDHAYGSQTLKTIVIN
jgi:PKD repeat protein